MTLDDKFAHFNLTEQAAENFNYIAGLHASKNSAANSFIIVTKIIGAQENQPEEMAE